MSNRIDKTKSTTCNEGSNEAKCAELSRFFHLHEINGPISFSVDFVENHDFNFLFRVL